MERQVLLKGSLVGKKIKDVAITVFLFVIFPSKRIYLFISKQFAYMYIIDYTLILVSLLVLLNM